MPNTDGIEKELLGRAEGASVADLGTIAAAMKAVAETKQTELTARTKERENKLELFKSAAAVLVPVVSLLALLFTVLAQNRQLEAGRQQLEDTEWRDLLTSLKGTSDAVYSDPTVAPRLRSFFASRSYGDQAKSIAGRLMGRISNPEGYADLFNSVFGEVDAQNVGSILDIFRTLRTSEQNLYDQCNDLLRTEKVPFDPGLQDCANYIDDGQAAGLIAKFSVPAQFLSLRKSIMPLNRELQISNNKIVAFLRVTYHLPRDYKSTPNLDISETKFVNSDLSQLDLTGFNIAGTVFDGVDFTGAVIKPKAVTDGSQPGSRSVADQPDFRGSVWWEAQSVEPTLLRFLAQWYQPYVFQGIHYFPGYQIKLDDYVARLSKLCDGAGIVCRMPSQFNFPPAYTSR